MREDGRSRRYLAWHAIAAWNSGRRASWSKSKYTTRWRRHASVSRSSGVYAPGVTGPVSGAGATVLGGGGAGSSLTFLEQATATVHIIAINSTLPNFGVAFIVVPRLLAGGRTCLQGGPVGRESLRPFSVSAGTGPRPAPGRWRPPRAGANARGRRRTRCKARCARLPS